MHKCSKCGRAASSLEEIDAGCPCGSKAFIFDRQIAQAVATEGNGGVAGAAGNGNAGGSGGLTDAAGNGNYGVMEANGSAMGAGATGNGGNGNPAAGNVGAPSTFAVAETAKDKAQEMHAKQDGKMPSSYYARMSFASEDVENIKVLTQGVFLLDVNAISKNPVVLKDEDEIYYVKLPLVQKKTPSPDKETEGNGSKNGKRE